MPRMSKSFDEYLENSGWSSHLFQKHASYLYLLLGSVAVIKVGRTVITMESKTSKIKFYVHHNGRSKEYMTITDAQGNELITYHHTVDPQKIYNDVKVFLFKD